MPVTLHNRSWQMQVFNLVHDAYCRGRACACSDITTVVVEENPRTGERAPRRVPKRLPTVLTLLAREVRTGLPNSVLQVPDIQAAITRGILRVVAQTPEPPPPAAPPTKRLVEVHPAPASEVPRSAGAMTAVPSTRGGRTHEGPRARSTAAADRKEA